jgi:hypothetical protein
MPLSFLHRAQVLSLTSRGPCHRLCFLVGFQQQRGQGQHASRRPGLRKDPGQGGVQLKARCCSPHRPRGWYRALKRSTCICRGYTGPFPSPTTSVSLHRPESPTLARCGPPIGTEFIFSCPLIILGCVYLSFCFGWCRDGPGKSVWLPSIKTQQPTHHARTPTQRSSPDHPKNTSGPLLAAASPRVLRRARHPTQCQAPRGQDLSQLPLAPTPHHSSQRGFMEKATGQPKFTLRPPDHRTPQEGERRTTGGKVSMRKAPRPQSLQKCLPFPTRLLGREVEHGEGVGRFPQPKNTLTLLVLMFLVW